MKTAGWWLFTARNPQTIDKIVAGGWEPRKHKETKYGCGVYLSRKPWYGDAPRAIVCKVNLPDEAVLFQFEAEAGWEHEGVGNTERFFGRYVKARGLYAGNRLPTSAGDSALNIAIREHFLALGIKAVMFKEHDHDAIVVFDENAITIEKDMPLAEALAFIQSEGSQGEPTSSTEADAGEVDAGEVDARQKLRSSIKNFTGGVTIDLDELTKDKDDEKPIQ